MSTSIAIADFELETEVWKIEGRDFHVNAVSVFHPVIQYGIENEFFCEISASELYGIIRSYSPGLMMVTPTESIMIALFYPNDRSNTVDYYKMCWSSYSYFQDFFIGKKPHSKIDWSKEGF